MTSKFTVPCDFSGNKSPVTFYVGDAKQYEHPIGFQSKWLAEERGGTVPKELMDSLAKLKEISDKHKVNFEELCAYVIEEIESAAVVQERVDVVMKIQSKIKKKRDLINQRLQKKRQEKAHATAQRSRWRS